MTDARQSILAAFNAALTAVDPARAMATAATREIERAQPAAIDVIAIGKAAVPMARGAVSALDCIPHRVFVITKDDHAVGEIDPAWTLRYSSHPVLDERSLAATSELLTWLVDGQSDRPTWCLISGGGSALLELPIEGVSLADFQHLTRALLSAGADIYQLNTVRSRISQVKGGGLRSHIRSQGCTSFLLSDVLGNDPSVIASGPTVLSTRTAADAKTVLDQFGLNDSLPTHLRNAILAEHEYRLPMGNDDRIEIVADNGTALETAALALADQGNVEVAWRDQTGEAADRARVFVALLQHQPKSVHAVLGGGELTVTVRGDGLGGRNTEFALAAAIALRDANLTDWAVASLATDGQDSLTGFAGAIVDASSCTAMESAGFDPGAELSRNNSAPPLEAIGATVFTGPTGTNVNDLYLAVRTQPA